MIDGTNERKLLIDQDMWTTKSTRMRKLAIALALAACAAVAGKMDGRAAPVEQCG